MSLLARMALMGSALSRRGGLRGTPVFRPKLRDRRDPPGDPIVHGPAVGEDKQNGSPNSWRIEKHQGLPSPQKRRKRVPDFGKAETLEVFYVGRRKFFDPESLQTKGSAHIINPPPRKVVDGGLFPSDGMKVQTAGRKPNQPPARVLSIALNHRDGLLCVERKVGGGQPWETGGASSG